MTAPEIPLPESPLPEILVCPLTHTKLHREGDYLLSPTGIRYPLKDGLPILLPSAAILPEGTTLDQLRATPHLTI